MVSRILRLLTKHPLLVGIALLLMAESVVMTLFLPKAPPVVVQEAVAAPVEVVAEIPIGDFKVRNHQVPGEDHIIKFSVCLTTHPAFLLELESRCKEHEQRVREAVAIVARRAGQEILDESTLATLKRRMRIAIVGAIERPEGPEFDVLLPDFLMYKG